MLTMIAILSPFLALLILGLLYPLRHEARGAEIARSISHFLVLPALLSAFYLIKVTLIDTGVIAKAGYFFDLPFELGIYVSAENSPIIMSIIFSAAVFSFLLPQQKFVGSISLFGFMLLILLLISTSADLVISTAIFSIGNIIITYFLLKEENNSVFAAEITKDFLWQRLSDFLAFGGILIMLLDPNISLSQRSLVFSTDDGYLAQSIFYIAMAMRISTMTTFGKSRPYHLDPNGTSRILIRLFFAIGALILLSQFRAIIFNDNNWNNIFLAVSIVLFIQAIFKLFTSKEKNKTGVNFCYLFSTLALISLCINQPVITVAILILLISIYPLYLLLFFNTNNFTTIIPQQNKASQENNTSPIIDAVALQIPTYFSVLLSNIFSVAIVPFYSNFLLYRLPQFLIAIVQTPLGIFHNGSIRRSLIFIILVLSFYYILWSY